VGDGVAATAGVDAQAQSTTGTAATRRGRPPKTNLDRAERPAVREKVPHSKRGKR
jgi:hypothetical protein